METERTAPTACRTGKPRRRLKPEVAARFTQAVPPRIDHLYEKPVDELTDRELQCMKAAFFRGADD
ncbi:MAG TPA: hypothetical protein VFL93_12395 [Longimicrobiaceae bacterium]|nr:hypothetical protein [Longimicrobiaceae bacterium]